jgi:flagellar biosynthesis protein FlhF
MSRSKQKRDEERGMRMKSFFAPTVQDAVEQARRELGPEALLVNSRKAPPEAQGLGEYEVVFAVLPEGAEGQGTGDGTAEPGDRGKAPAAEDQVLRELARLRKQIEEMGSSLTEINAQAYSWAVPAPEFAEALSRLVDGGFSVDVAKRVVKQAHARLDTEASSWSRRKPFDRDLIEGAVRTELESLVSTGAGLDCSEEKSQVVALVGPPGGGKTTTLVKLAVRYGVSSSRPVYLISTDTSRVGGAEQLRTYAAIIGAGFQAVETARSLQQALEMRRGKGLILIDTPGYAAPEMEEATDLARFLAQERSAEVHLVAPATMRSADLSSAIERFEVFSPAKLIFTHLDETSALGAAVSASVRSGKAISFLGTGQQIPENLEPATAARLLESVLERRAERALSAA